MEKSGVFYRDHKISYEHFKTFYKDHKRVINHFLFVLGLLTVLVSCLAYFVLGTGCYIQINDQLDGEVLNYIYRAKYLFSGEGNIPEFMNGMSKSAMTPPAPVGVIFYKILPPFAAFAAMHIFVIVTGYTGMFLLIRQVTDSGPIAFVVACIFAYLPFYPVYGLSILGQPLLLWALIRIYQTKEHKLKYYFCIFLYGISSSFALAGFAIVPILFAAWVVLRIREVREGQQNSVGENEVQRERGLRQPVHGSLGLAFLLLSGTYLLCNLDLAAEILGIGNSYVSHREEMIIAARSDWEDYFLELFLEGGSYGKSYNMAIAILAAVLLAGCPFICYLTKKKLTRTYKALAALTGAAALLAGGAVLWRIEPIARLRMEAGGVVKYFQADRIYWLLPLCWYLILALGLKILLAEWKRLWVLRYGAALGITVVLSFMVYQNSTIYHNLRLMIFPDTYHLMNWEDYYAEDVFEQIDSYIGQDKASYRTLSLGISPAAALYNGFYCLDGYSNLYSLEYKHEFREIIAKELDKVEEVRVYFDAWGNRCCLFNAETGNYMMIPGNNGGAYEHLELNTRKMYDMGARYLFAAMPIANAEEMGGLTLVREEPFTTPDSYYAVWLYEVTGE